MDNFSRAWLAQEAKRAFFPGMLSGYIAGGIPGLPVYAFSGVEPSKLYAYRDTNTKDEFTGWEVHDSYMVGENGYSAGMTIITYQERPVWHMQYWGHYDKAAIPLLKAALRKNYETGVFYGGRGPGEFEDPAWPNMIYSNGTLNSGQSSFNKFSGIEGISIADPTLRIIGTHQYQGGLLI